MSRLQRALHRFGELSPRERRLLALASGLLPVVHGLQQRLPFRVWRPLLEQLAPARAPALARAPEGSLRQFFARAPEGALRPETPSVREIAWSVEAARNWLPGSYKCLPSAYAVHLLLHRYGYESRIQVGVGRDAAGVFEAHAWVECEGRTVIGAVDDPARFVPLPPLRPVAR
jgi:hypothetical protein